MGLITKEIEVGLGGDNIKYYEELGYEIPRRIDKYNKLTIPKGIKILIKADDLSNGSHVKVDLSCDECGKILKDIVWKSYKRCIKEDGKYYCKKCSSKLFSGEKIRKTKLLKTSSVSETNPNFNKYFVNIEDAKKYSYGSEAKVAIICPNCGYIKHNTTIKYLIKRGFACPRCSDGISYPEKIMYSVLEQLNIDFQTQLTKTTFEWCEDFKYDFYIPNIGIIETHGEQHYKESSKSSKFKHTLKEEQENDKIKKTLAIKNSVKNYISIDCRKSDLEYIKDNILNSELPQLLNFKESNINWLKCHEFALNNLVKVTCDMWNNGIHNTLEISNKLKIHRHTIIEYLKQGAKIKWTNYNPKEQIKLKNKNQSIPVICIINGKIYQSIKEASIKCNIAPSTIRKYCKETEKSEGKSLITRKWMHYNEYIIKNEIESHNTYS